MKGILVGCDAAQEWLLPWWWENYSRLNKLPVAFADFGMSLDAKQWCQEKGQLLSVPELRVASKEELRLSNVWENNYYGSNYGPIWEMRKIWFRKPSALLESPFETTLWLDLDCEILADLSNAFEYCDSKSGVGIAPEPIVTQEYMRELDLLLPGEIPYNSGVIVYRQNSPLIQQWADTASSGSREFGGDQEVISRLIYQGGWQINELPAIYNWRMNQGLNLNAVVIHWVSAGGKKFIREKGGLGREFTEYRRMF